jgi:hypothetical protein
VSAIHNLIKEEVNLHECPFSKLIEIIQLEKATNCLLLDLEKQVALEEIKVNNQRLGDKA